MLGGIMGGAVRDPSMQYLETFCINGCKKVLVYYRFIQRTGHAILFVDEGTIIKKSASSDFDIARALEHRWIQRRVTSIEGFRGSGSDVACNAVLMSKIRRFAFIMGRENKVQLNWDGE
jgi:hypothetical protein